MRHALLALAATVLLVLPQTVAACEPDASLGLSERDDRRLAGLIASRTEGLAAALLEPEAATRQTVAALYRGGLESVEATAAVGDYRCRTIKLGGILPAVVYGYFECSISEGADGLDIVKTTGSQRFSGRLIASGASLAYVGALNYSDEGPMAYQGASERDQVGCLWRNATDGETLVLELPSPQFESFHDVIELVPRR